MKRNPQWSWVGIGGEVKLSSLLSILFILYILSKTSVLIPHDDVNRPAPPDTEAFFRRSTLPQPPNVSVSG